MGSLSPAGTEQRGARIIGANYAEKISDGPGPQLMLADTLAGNKVVNLEDENLGKIDGIMLDVQSGHIAYAVLSVGGLFGLGDRLFAIPWSALTLDVQNKRFILDADEERLKNAPGFDKDRWPSMADNSWALQVHTYYNRRPYWE